MSRTLIVTGTDTGIGKTVFAAGLVGFLASNYWKPVQAGTEEETDSEVVRRLSAQPDERILPEGWRLTIPASPHLSAEHDGVAIDAETLAPPVGLARPLVIEAAGGLMVPLTRKVLQIDVFARWGLPVVLCARTTLGTINHSLLSIEALRRRGIAVLGIAFIGEANVDSERTICEMGNVHRLGRLPWLAPLTASTLAAAFADAFRREDFE